MTRDGGRGGAEGESAAACGDLCTGGLLARLQVKWLAERARLKTEAGAEAEARAAELSEQSPPLLLSSEQE